MTDRQKAIEFFRERLTHGLMREVKAMVMEAINALEELEAMDDWHDLRKDPTDLPEGGKDVIVSDVDTDETYSGYYAGSGYWKTDDGFYQSRIIAWKPFPKFYEGE